ncbi:NAD(P)-binding protein [Pluteus cervinus]|uniref:NAD(P)-binding protein n=1 Tax=Pluteus cervinus TaxID=181527 RepID=A0ACD3A510_9AGAR|nr:NAD(P)-binding protein [Pluteus cervinus]
MSAEALVWLVTGASSGFGRMVAEIALKRGDMVVATLRTPSMLSDLVESTNLKYPTEPPHLLALKCDVTRHEDVVSVFDKTISVYGRCDLVFSNAGALLLGEVENPAQDKLARELFEINFWAAIDVSREAVRVFRDVNPIGKGRASVTIEGWSETLAKELDPSWNIKVVILEPGAFNTGIQRKAVNHPPPPAYVKNPDIIPPSIQARSYFATEGERNMGNPYLCMERVVQGALLPDPPSRLVLGKDAIAGCKAKLEEMKRDIEKYEAWSDTLYPHLESGL